ncbi:hypothetical protein BJ684DRAFT_10328 [Piptocephalis cylindrospora]|uniref:Dynamin-type G domain-containing protein n=1 Tax=Piptocephalis cylindrospora TaxID=1907219 RepID=A0A4P9Y606_9FUNG|nr:hypothetical protein BJ684DRAFT_10328 [Piptocephalis cylindrospora]|eukprot:RKP13260.1 hypothetical protein BJ684DRAFT_10328 [Piptocephalis cylindrospora]
MSPVPTEDSSPSASPSSSSASLPGGTSSSNSDTRQFKVLNLDLQLGGASPSAPELLSSLEPGSLATLLDAQLAGVLSHLGRLGSRVADTSSKVLVTGDVNAGKSTFINALMRRAVVPSDQQPLTTAFCEVMDARMNGGVEEAHLCRPGETYNRLDSRTYTPVGLEHLEEVAADFEAEEGRVVKVYSEEADPGLLSNGAVDVALVDSPGLNTDSLKTLACFAFQEEIDVVVFVVNSENHFTQSGREFMVTAGREKAYIFVVVNKYDLIRRKDRCKEAILKQLSEVSPETREDAGDLVHFVSAEGARQSREAQGPDAPVAAEWARMERSLRGFILEKRARSKLGPAQRYLLQLLGDLRVLASTNRRRTERAERDAERTLSDAIPRCRSGEEEARRDTEGAEREMDAACDAIVTEVRTRLTLVMDTLEDRVVDPEWQGWVHTWSYIQEVRSGMVRAWDREVSTCERMASDRVQEGTRRILQLGKTRLAAYPPREPDLARLFEERRRGRKSTSSRKKGGSGAVPGAGEGSLAFGLEVTDLVDVRERLGLATVSVGGMAMIGGQLIGARRLLMDVVTFGGLLGGRLARQMLAVGVAATALGLGLYIIGDVKHAVQRRVAAKCRKVLLADGILDGHVDRISRRSHSALRYGVQDLTRRYELLLEEAQRERMEGERVAKEASEGRRYYKALGRRIRELEEMIRSVDTNEKKVPLPEPTDD